MKLVAVLLTWTACLLPYLASNKQQLLQTKINKPASWLGFCLLISISVWLLSSYYSALVASLILLTLIMCLWICLTLMATHLNFIRVGSISLTLFTLVSLVGEI